MIRFACSNCGKALGVDDRHAGRPIRCPGCQAMTAIPLAEELPAPVAAPPPAAPAPIKHPAIVVVQAPPAPPPARDCPYCGEEVQAVARKCRHCGEVLDPALREALEAKALAARQAPPVVISNNVSASASAAASSGPGWRRPSLLRSFLRMAAVAGGLILSGAVLAAAGARDAGVAAAFAGTTLLVVGVPVYLLRGAWRLLFG